MKVAQGSDAPGRKGDDDWEYQKRKKAAELHDLLLESKERRANAGAAASAPAPAAVPSLAIPAKRAVVEEPTSGSASARRVKELEAAMKAKDDEMARMKAMIEELARAQSAPATPSAAPPAASPPMAEPPAATPPPKPKPKAKKGPKFKTRETITPADMAALQGGHPGVTIRGTTGVYGNE